MSAPTIFAEEHDALRETVRRFVDREIAPRIAELEDAGAVAGDVFVRAGALGVLDLADLPAAVAVAEELGRCGSGGVWEALLTQMDAAVASSGTEVAEGARLAAVVDGGLRARRTDGGWSLSGSSEPVANALVAEQLVVLADGMVFVTGLEGALIEPAPNPYGCHAAGLAVITLTEAPAVAAEVDAGALRARRRLLRAAAAVSAAGSAWASTREYGLAREAFGRPIARFQVNRHALAEMATRIEGARQLVYEATHRLARGGQAEPLVSAARLVAGRLLNDVADRCLQLHGGYGYSMEHDVQRVWRDARHLRLTDGGDEALLEDIAGCWETS